MFSRTLRKSFHPDEIVRMEKEFGREKQIPPSEWERLESRSRLQRHWLLGFLAGGPLLLPGRPLMFEVSCSCPVGFCWFDVEPEPTLSRGFAAGPLLFPG